MRELPSGKNLQKTQEHLSTRGLLYPKTTNRRKGLLDCLPSPLGIEKVSCQSEGEQNEGTMNKFSGNSGETE
jgi:hypothetical protein